MKEKTLKVVERNLISLIVLDVDEIDQNRLFAKSTVKTDVFHLLFLMNISEDVCEALKACFYSLGLARDRETLDLMQSIVSAYNEQDLKILVSRINIFLGILYGCMLLGSVQEYELSLHELGNN